jgi:phosphatidate cytidylyltransferase
MTPPAASGGTAARVLTAAVLIPLVVAAAWWGPTWLIAVVTGAVILLALYEFFRLGLQVGMRGYFRWTVVCALLLVAQQWAASEVQTFSLGSQLTVQRGGGAAYVSLELVLLLFALGAGVIALGSRRGLAETLPALGISAAGLLLIALPFSYVVRLHGLERLGPQLLLFTLALIWAGDTLAYFTGRAVGRIPMAPLLSPKKTWEGAAGNLVGSLLVAIPFARWMELDPVHVVLMAAAANVAGQVGDLVESAYKRSAGAKDSGVLLPGHGGILDRIDSLIFAAPVVWCYFGFVIQGRW